MHLMSHALGPHPICSSSAVWIPQEEREKQASKHNQPQLNRFASAETLETQIWQIYAHVADKGLLWKYELDMEIQVFGFGLLFLLLLFFFLQFAWNIFQNKSQSFFCAFFSHASFTW